MKVKELSREQLIELKQYYLATPNKDCSYMDLADADKKVSDKEIFEVFGDTDFTPGDFYSKGREEVTYERFIEDLKVLRNDPSKMFQYLTFNGDRYEDDCSNYTLGLHTTYFDDFEITFLALSYVVNTPCEGDLGYGSAKCLEGWTDEMIWAEITQNSDKVYRLD